MQTVRVFFEDQGAVREVPILRWETYGRPLRSDGVVIAVAPKRPVPHLPEGYACHPSDNAAYPYVAKLA